MKILKSVRESAMIDFNPEKITFIQDGGKNTRGAKGFTLTEMLMALAVLAVLVYSIYTLFSRTVKNVDVGDWKTKTQTKLRMATKQLSKDIACATYPSTIKLNDTIVEKDVKWNLKFKDGRTEIKKGVSDTLLEFYICTPARDLPDDKSPQKIIKAVLKVTENPVHMFLTYYKSIEKGTAAPIDDLKTINLVEDAVCFDAKLIKNEDNTTYDAANKVKYILKIEIQCAHPRYPLTIVTEHIDVPLLVKTNSQDPKSNN